MLIQTVRASPGGHIKNHYMGIGFQEGCQRGEWVGGPKGLTFGGELPGLKLRRQPPRGLPQPQRARRRWAARPGPPFVGTNEDLQRIEDQRESQALLARPPAPRRCNPQNPFNAMRCSPRRFALGSTRHHMYKLVSAAIDGAARPQTRHGPDRQRHYPTANSGRRGCCGTGARRRALQRAKKRPDGTGGPADREKGGCAPSITVTPFTRAAFLT